MPRNFIRFFFSIVLHYSLNSWLPRNFIQSSFPLVYIISWTVSNLYDPLFHCFTLFLVLLETYTILFSVILHYPLNSWLSRNFIRSFSPLFYIISCTVRNLYGPLFHCFTLFLVLLETYTVLFSIVLHYSLYC